MANMAERAEKPKICFITTQGEITQVSANEYADPRDIAPHLEKIAGIDVSYWEHYQSIASNIYDDVAKAIRSRLRSYDGFVVTGGKYDLQTIAPRLAFAFGPNLNRTIAVTGSNSRASALPIEAERDLIRATMAASQPFNEVVVSFGNQVVRGTSHALNHLALGVVSYDSYRKYGQLADFTELSVLAGRGIKINHLRDSSNLGAMKFLPDLESQVLPVWGLPGSEPELIKARALTAKGVIFSTEGIDLVERDPYSFLPLIDSLKWKGVPVLVIRRNVPDLSERGYLVEADYTLETLGAIIAREMSPMTAITKFHWVIRRVEKEISAGKIIKSNKLARVKEWMKSPYVGEFGIDRPFNSIRA